MAQEHEWMYRPIDPNQKYDRKGFVNAFDDFSDLESYLEQLVKDPRNIDAMSDLGGLLFKNPKFFLNVDDPLITREHADAAHSESVESMARYVKGNFDEFLDKCGDDDVVKYVQTVPLYKTTGSRGQANHNNFIDALSAVRNVQEIASEEKPEVRHQKMGKYVAGKIKGAPKWFQEAFPGASSNEAYIQELFKSYSSEDFKKLSKMIKDEEGNIKRGFLEGVIKDSLEEAYYQQNEETNEKDKKDIWKGDIRPYYIALAGIVHPKEKAAEKKDDNPERVARKKVRKGLGMKK